MLTAFLILRTRQIDKKIMRKQKSHFANLTEFATLLYYKHSLNFWNLLFLNCCSIQNQKSYLEVCEIQKNLTTCFIGCGNMGTAILSGLLRAHSIPNDSISIVQTSPIRVKLLQKYGVAFQSLQKAMQNSKYILLAVKPNGVKTALQSMQKYFKNDYHVLMTMLAGVPISYFRQSFTNPKVIRIMPNTPAKASMGKGKNMTDQEMSNAKYIMQAVGTVEQINQSLFDAATAISGCGVAYFLSFIEALQNAGVRQGLSRNSRNDEKLGKIELIIFFQLHQEDKYNLQEGALSKVQLSFNIKDFKDQYTQPQGLQLLRQNNSEKNNDKIRQNIQNLQFYQQNNSALI